jgi:hypothetical protein
MKHRTSKNRLKQIKQNQDNRNLFQSFNGHSLRIDEKGLEKTFPDKKERLLYIESLIELFS